ncbi:MAG: hypothetical protein M3464_17550 [Chloroflexota bacterium]|nr:hypothetical protein [Chloroflexota bacterium]
MARSISRHTYLWCTECRRSYRHEDAPDDRCPVCQREMRPIGKFAAIARGLMANELVTPDITIRHRQLIRLIWTRNGMGERYYHALAPDVPYTKFEARVTELLERGATEGWVRFVLPAAPSASEGDYRLEFDSDERFVQELGQLFPPVANPSAPPP